MNNSRRFPAARNDYSFFHGYLLGHQDIWIQVHLTAQAVGHVKKLIALKKSYVFALTLNVRLNPRKLLRTLLLTT